MNSAALKLIEGNKQDRDRYINKTDVLDKVKNIVMLPDEKYVSIRQVADYYEVSKKTIDTIILRNKDELVSDGMKVLKGKDLKLYKLTYLHGEGDYKRVPALTVFTRRAMLRVGMLLTESPVATKVRDYLLDVENNHRNSLFWTEEKQQEAIKLMKQCLVNDKMNISNSLALVSNELGVTKTALTNQWYGSDPNKTSLKSKYEQLITNDGVKNNHSKNEDMERMVKIFISNQNDINNKMLNQLKATNERVIEIFEFAFKKENNDDNKKIFQGLHKLYKDMNELKELVNKDNNETIEILNNQIVNLKRKLSNERKEKDKLLKRFGQIALDESLNYEPEYKRFKMDKNGNIDRF